MANIGYLAAVENYGNTEGDYAQFEESTFNDLKKRRKLPEGLSWTEVQKNPAKYDAVVDVFWQDLSDTFGIPDDDYTKTIWTLMPGRYKATGGDISKLTNSKHRNIMNNRVVNLNTYIKGSK